MLIRQIVSQQEPVGRIFRWLGNRIRIKYSKSIPIGVIGIIYESRPNVTSDTAALCFKSGNVCVLKGGKEAEHSNKAIAVVLRDVLAKINYQNKLFHYFLIQVEGVAKLIKEDKYIRFNNSKGGESLIRYVGENSSIPVIKHDKGVCHIYVDKDSTCKENYWYCNKYQIQRPSACNSMETLLIHEEIAPYILWVLKRCIYRRGTILKGCGKL